ncbi:MAG TPA: ATP-binding protein [Kineosporiaceae bacterium]|jgi:anti-sigma regulatory factor (Ser/Thr protein kinase)|nr:ATP-binding protein [Kineosporiaceae bacterium]
MEPTAVVSLPSSPQAPSAARRMVAGVGADWPPHVLDAALLAVSEAVTNAVRHGSGQIRVCLDVGDRFVRIEVSDEGADWPRSREAGSEADGGRGLHLIEALSDSWGTEAHADGPGKTVWMQLPRA